jgi:hypothetical protein
LGSPRSDKEILSEKCNGVIKQYGQGVRLEPPPRPARSHSFSLGLWRGVIAPVTLIAEIINQLVPHVLPWRPNFLEDGAGAAYGLGVHRTLSGAPHLVLHGWASRSPANRPAVQALEGGRRAAQR